MDQIDGKILRERTRDGRISNAAPSERVGLSPPACHRRVQKLERRESLRGYRAVPEPKERRAGFVACMTVGLSSHTNVAQESFGSALAPAPEGVESHAITGRVDHGLRVETQDLVACKRFHTDRLGSFLHVNALTTYVGMGAPKGGRA